MIIVVICINGMVNVKINIVYLISFESDACKSGDAFRIFAAIDRNDMVCVDEFGLSVVLVMLSIVNLMVIVLNLIINVIIVFIKSIVVVMLRIYFFVSL